MAPAFWSLNTVGGTDLLRGVKPPRPDGDVPDARATPERAEARGPPTPRCLRGGWEPPLLAAPPSRPN